MSRVKRGVTAHARHKKILDMAKGYRGRNKNVFRVAVEKVEKMSDMQYNQMKDSIDQFAKLIRGGYFTKRALIEAVFKAQYE